MTERQQACLKHAAEWQKIADEQENTPPGRERRKLYERCAESFRMEAKDGIARCVCCLQPFKGTCYLKPLEG
jgi:hypothetical protein